MLKVKTDWRERARLFFESQREVKEQPPRFRIMQYHHIQEPRERYVIVNPCPYCNPTGKRGGSLFPDLDPHTNQWYVKCLCCSRILKRDDGRYITWQEWEATHSQSDAIRNGQRKAKANGKDIGRPKKSPVAFLASKY